MTDAIANNTWTFFIRDKDLSAITTYITSATTSTLQEARVQALNECAADWDTTTDQLWVQGIAVGEFDILEWDDEGDVHG